MTLFHSEISPIEVEVMFVKTCLKLLKLHDLISSSSEKKFGVIKASRKSEIIRKTYLNSLTT